MPPTQYESVGQRVQATDERGEYHPDSHGVQLTPPADNTAPELFFTTEPAPQLTQSVAASDPATTTYLPSLHAMQPESEDAPDVSPYFPAPQSMHRFLESGLYLPLPHFAHVAAPGIGGKVEGAAWEEDNDQRRESKAE